jgi:capsular polysaccharide biosynthesis protein
MLSKKRISRFLEHHSKFLLPYNYKFQPKGIYLTSEDFIKSKENPDACLITIYKDYNLEMHLPEGLEEKFPSYYKPELKARLDYVVVEVPEGRIYQEDFHTVAIISRDNMLIGDISLQYWKSKVQPPEKALILKQTYFESPLELDGTVFNLCTGGGGKNNYAHFLLDSVSRIHLLKKSGLFDSVDYFFVPCLKYDFQRDIFKLLGIPASKLISGDEVKHVKAKKVITSTFPRGNTEIIPKWIIDFYRSELLDKLKVDNEYPELVYVSRSDSRIRNVENEGEIKSFLESKGFKCYELSSLSLLEKAKLFYNAKILVSTIGAGLTNNIFCNPEASIIEFFPPQFPMPHYADIALKLGLDHHYIIGTTSNKRVSNNLHLAQRDHVFIDLEQLDELIRKINNSAAVSVKV